MAPYIGLSSARSEASQVILDSTTFQPLSGRAESLLSGDQPTEYDIKYSKEIETTCEEIYIDNAGLILVWPYLGHFFQSVGLMNDGAFVDEESISGAIHLLQFLATGEEQTAEYFLPLNKLLCGLDLENPISKNFHLSKQEKEECEKLLKTVIKHWSALKNTSVMGFLKKFST